MVVASQGGLPTHPQWYFNLVAHPQTRVHLKGRPNLAVVARVASKQERAVLWPRLVDLYADFAKYQTWTQREIPVVVLAPACGSSPSPPSRILWVQSRRVRGRAKWAMVLVSVKRVMAEISMPVRVRTSRPWACQMGVCLSRT